MDSKLVSGLKASFFIILALATTSAHAEYYLTYAGQETVEYVDHPKYHYSKHHQAKAKPKPHKQKPHHHHYQATPKISVSYYYNLVPAIPYSDNTFDTHPTTSAPLIRYSKPSETYGSPNYSENYSYGDEDDYTTVDRATVDDDPAVDPDMDIDK